MQQVNPLNIYNNRIGKHILLSEIYENMFSTILHVEKVRIHIHTNNEYVGFLNFYLLMNKKTLPKKFYLSKAQKKYQTMFRKEVILVVSLINREFNRMLHYLSQNIFHDYIKQPQDNAVDNKKHAFIVKINGIPFLMYNKSILFKAVFSHNINVLNIQTLVNFNTQSLSKRSWYFKYYKIIAPLRLEWAHTK